MLIRAHRAVIIASGNFTYNLEFLGRHRPEFAACHKEMIRAGSMGDDGNGLEMALSVSGTLGNMDAVTIARPLNPPLDFIKGVLVNSDGQRYINEDAYNAHIGLATSQQKDFAAWLILDSRTFWSGIRQNRAAQGDVLLARHSLLAQHDVRREQAWLDARHAGSQMRHARRLQARSDDRRL